MSFVLDDDDEHDDVHEEDENEGYEESAEVWDGRVSTKTAPVVPLFVLYLKYCRVLGAFYHHFVSTGDYVESFLGQFVVSAGF